MPRKPAIGFALFTLLLDAIGIGLGIPVFPLLVQRIARIGPDNAAYWLSLFVATYAAMNFLFAPLLGALSDRYGRRPVLLLSIAGLGLDYVLLAVAPNLAWVFVARLLAGATGANISTVNAYVADVTPPAERAGKFGLLGAAFGVGFIFGPVLGGLLGHYDLRLPFLAAAGLSGVNFIYGYFVLPESLAPENRRPFTWRGANVAGALAMVWASPVLKRLGAAWCGLQFAFGALPATFVLFAALRLGWGPWESGEALAFVGATQAVVQGLLARRIIPFLGERLAGVIGLSLSACAYATYAFATQGWMIYAGATIQAFGTIGPPAIRALMSATAGPERQGAIAGAISSLEGLTAIFSPFVAGFLFAWFSGPSAPLFLPGAAFLAASACCLASAVLVRGVRPPAALAPASAAAPA